MMHNSQHTRRILGHGAGPLTCPTKASPTAVDEWAAPCLAEVSCAQQLSV